jgi:uncharacterized protein involved in exopolysaccharide biosynthesis
MNSNSKNNDDVKQHLLKIEERLDRLSVSPPLSFDSFSGRRDDEIDLREIWNILWGGKWWIIGITFLFASAGVLYALSLPNLYKSEGIYAPTQKQGSNALGGQLGGLASLAGVSLGGGESNDIDQAVKLIASWPFLEKVINKHKLKPFIMGVKGWDRESGELIWDKEIYDPVAKEWVREPPKGMEAEPSSFEVYARLSKLLSVSFDKKTGMLDVAVEFYSPIIAEKWVRILVAELNEAFRLRDMAESKKNILYLEKKISETSIAGMQAVFYGMVESQIKTLMLAEVDEQYLIKQVVEPKVPELKSSPDRKIIVALSILMGGFLSCVVVFIVSFLRGRG